MAADMSPSDENSSEFGSKSWDFFAESGFNDLPEEEQNALIAHVAAEIRKHWRRFGHCADDINEPDAVLTSTFRSVARQADEGELDPTACDLEDVLIVNARRKADTACHFHATQRAKKEVRFSTLDTHRNDGGDVSVYDQIACSDQPELDSEANVDIPEIELVDTFDISQQEGLLDYFRVLLKLSKRELSAADQKVLFLWAAGKSIPETARELAISEHSVKRSRKRIKTAFDR